MGQGFQAKGAVALFQPGEDGGAVFDEQTTYRGMFSGPADLSTREGYGISSVYRRLGCHRLPVVLPPE